MTRATSLRRLEAIGGSNRSRDTASGVLSPWAVMQSTTSSSGVNRPARKSASAAAQVTPPAVSANTPEVSVKDSNGGDQFRIRPGGGVPPLDRGFSARLFNAVNEVNIEAISRGASEINMTFIVREDEGPTAVRALHHEFFGGAAVPELPDIVNYRDALRERIIGQTLLAVRLKTPFLLRTVEPTLASCHGHRVAEVQRIGKRLAIGLDTGAWLVIHLMIAGRLLWKAAGATIGAKFALAAFDFDQGTLVFTEAGSKRRASLHVVGSRADLDQFERGGLDILQATQPEFSERIKRGNHTLKRALTDPRTFDGIGNSFSDEILHAAGISPLQLTGNLDPSEVRRLYQACRRVLTFWTDALTKERNGAFPEKVTAFRPGMAVHGKFGKPCPDCGSPVQRIRYADNETNYCARCQTEGRLLADRALSRLLKQDWPKSLDELD